MILEQANLTNIYVHSSVINFIVLPPLNFANHRNPVFRTVSCTKLKISSDLNIVAKTEFKMKISFFVRYK